MDKSYARCANCGIILGPYDRKIRRDGGVLCWKCSNSAGTAAADQGDATIARLFKCMGDPCRIKIVQAMKDRERFVYEFAPITGVQYPTISYHLKLLKELGVVQSVERGNFVAYSLTDKGVILLGIIEKSREIA